MNKYIVGLAAAVVCCDAGGNYLLRRGMRGLGPLVSASPLAYLRALAHPLVLAGVLVLVSCLVAQLSLLSWADLTYVLPIAALGYVLAAMLGAFSLGEHVSLSRWASILLITAGVAVVSRTRARTAPVREEEPQ